MKIYYKKRSINIPVKKPGFPGKISGLMFHSPKKAPNLLFEFKNYTNISFHSYFVFFPFLIIWLDSKNKVIQWRIAKPFSSGISCTKKFRKCIEIPLKSENNRLMHFFVGKGKI